MASDSRRNWLTSHRREIANRGVLAVVLSLGINWLILWVVLTGDLVEPFDALSFPPVSLLTVLGALGATIAYGLLVRYVERPDRTFVGVAIVVLLLSFVPDVAVLFFDAAATIPAVSVLMGMHVTVAVICIVVLTDPFELFPPRE